MADKKNRKRKERRSALKNEKHRPLAVCRGKEERINLLPIDMSGF